VVLQSGIAETWRRQGTSGQLLGTDFSRGGAKTDKIAPANGNKPISSLSDVAEPLVCDVMNYTRGGGSRELMLFPPKHSPEVLQTRAGPARQDGHGPLQTCRSSPITRG
jgi:hypothetical protein